MSLSEEAITLQRAAHELMYLGMDGTVVPSIAMTCHGGTVRSTVLPWLCTGRV